MGRRGRRRLREVEAVLTRDEERAAFWGAPVLDGPSTVGPMTLAELQVGLERAIAGGPPVHRVACRTRAEADELFDLARRAGASGIVLPPARRVRAPSDGAG